MKKQEKINLHEIEDMKVGDKCLVLTPMGWFRDRIHSIRVLTPNQTEVSFNHWPGEEIGSQCVYAEKDDRLKLLKESGELKHDWLEEEE